MPPWPGPARGASLYLAALALAPAASLAQGLVPPRALSTPEIPYPEGASGEAEVALRLRVSADGSVVEATPLSGAEPFASAAARAALRFRFEPATRDGKPIAAYVRFLLRFTPPPPPLPAGGPAAQGPAAGPAVAPVGQGSPAGPTRAGPGPGVSGARVEAEEEITVQGGKAPPGATRLSRAEVRQLPGAFGDPFRAIEALPGVTPLVSGAPFFYVRGAPPGNVGYFLDGVRVPYLFHVFLGPSVVNPALVQGVDLYPGGYPARYGRFSGGIVAGETTPPIPELHGEGVLRLFDAGAMVEAPFDGGRGTALVGGRYSYTALLFSLLSPRSTLDYWDYQARLSYRVGSGVVSVFAFGARDFLGQKQEDGAERTFFDTQFHRVDLRYDSDLGGRGEGRLALTFGHDRSGDDEPLRDRSVGVRSQNTIRVGRGALGFGADAVLGDVESPGAAPEDDAEASQRSLFRTRRDLAAGAYVEATVPLGPVTASPGARADLYAASGQGGGAALSVEPRLSLRAALSPRVRAIHTFGAARQPPSFVVPLPGFRPDPLRGGLQKSLQASAGVEVDLGAGVTGSATVFRSIFSDLSDALGAGPVGTDGPARFDGRVQGSSQGLEVYVRRPLTRRLGGYVSYTLSSSRRWSGRDEYPSNFDRTHVASGALGYEITPRWRAGLRFLFYTGQPRLDDRPGARLASDPGRLPPFHRFDLRVERRWSLGERGRLSLVFEFLNATLRSETFGRRCTERGCVDDVIGPIFVPSLGLEAQL